MCCRLLSLCGETDNASLVARFFSVKVTAVLVSSHNLASPSRQYACSHDSFSSPPSKIAIQSQLYHRQKTWSASGYLSTRPALELGTEGWLGALIHLLYAADEQLLGSVTPKARRRSASASQLDYVGRGQKCKTQASLGETIGRNDHHE